MGLVACAEGRGEGGSETGWESTRDTLGDTVVVRTLSGSVWGDTVTLVEEMSIGALEGSQQQIFGQIQEIAPDSSGGVYVFDGSVPALRYYDSTGRFVRTIGREGAGPGEYGDRALGLALLPDGRLAMHDPSNGRINFYAPDGTSAGQWRVESGLYTGDAMVVDTAGHVFVKVLLDRIRPGEAWPIGLLQLDTMGAVVDSIAPPDLAEEPPGAGWFDARKVWTMGPTRAMAVGINDEYSFDLRRPDGSVTRIQKEHRPVRLHPEERDELEAQRRWLIRRDGASMSVEPPPVGETKPAYRSLHVDRDERIWVRLHTSAEKIDDAVEMDARENRPPPVTWREPVVYDVFEGDGTYLGAVEPPGDRTALVAFQGDVVWGLRWGQFDEQYVIRFGLPSGAIAE